MSLLLDTDPKATQVLPARRRVPSNEKLTERSVRELMPRAVRYEVQDGAFRFLRLRVSPRGRKTWSVLRRQRTGKFLRVGLGTWPDTSVEAARELALEAAKNVYRGDHPTEQRRAAAATEKRKSRSLQVAFDEYQAKRKLRPNTLRTYASDLKVSCGDWLDKPLTWITPERVAERYAQRVTESPARANGFLRVLRAVYRRENVTYKAGLALPTELVSANNDWAKVPRKRTYLAKQSLAEWMRAVRALPDEAPPSDRGYVRDPIGTQRDALLLLISTGLRRQEGLGLRWSEVNFRDRVLVIPAARVKGKRDHWLPIAPRMFAMLKRRYQERRSDEYVFPGPHTRAPLKQISPRVFALIGVQFTAHDLRRTALTMLESMDISAYALKKIANHAEGEDLMRGYIGDDVNRLRKPLVQLEQKVFGRAR